MSPTFLNEDLPTLCENNFCELNFTIFWTWVCMNNIVNKIIVSKKPYWNEYVTLILTQIGEWWYVLKWNHAIMHETYMEFFVRTIIIFILNIDFDIVSILSWLPYFISETFNICKSNKSYQFTFQICSYDTVDTPKGILLKL